MCRKFCESLMVEIEKNEMINKHYANIYMDFPGGTVVKNQPASAGDLGLISGLGRSPGEGNGNPLQNSCLGNSMDTGAWWAAVRGVAKSWTQLSHQY